MLFDVCPSTSCMPKFWHTCVTMYSNFMVIVETCKGLINTKVMTRLVSFLEYLSRQIKKGTDLLYASFVNFCINWNQFWVIILENTGVEIRSSTDQYIFILGFLKMPERMNKPRNVYIFFTVYWSPHPYKGIISLFWISSHMIGSMLICFIYNELNNSIIQIEFNKVNWFRNVFHPNFEYFIFTKSMSLISICWSMFTLSHIHPSSGLFYCWAPLAAACILPPLLLTYLTISMCTPVACQTLPPA